MTWTVPPNAYANTAFANVAISSANDLGSDGVTLSDINSVSGAGLIQSQTNPGYWQGTGFVALPGTYYWQVQVTYVDMTSTAIVTLVSPIYSITILAPPPPPTPPQPTPAPATPTLSLSVAKQDVPLAIKQTTHHSPQHLTALCVPQSTDSVACNVAWTDPSYKWHGVLMLTLNTSQNTVDYSFNGSRAGRGCLARHRPSRCAHSVSF